MNLDFFRLLQNGWEKFLSRFQNVKNDSFKSIKQAVLNTPIPQPLVNPIQNALSQARFQVARLQQPFFTAGYFGVKPWQVTPRMRVNIAVNEGRTSWGSPLPIASSETGYNPFDIPSPGEAESWRLSQRVGPLYSVSPSNLGGRVFSPQMPPYLIKFLPNALQEIKMRSEKLPPVRYKEQIPKGTVSFKDLTGAIL